MPEATAVYFADLRTSPKENLSAKFLRLVEAAGLTQTLRPRGLVALKLHFGEKGNMAFVHPLFLRALGDHIKAKGACPFLTDANTLYAGTRGDTVSHITTAIENGFTFSVTQMPIVIADGLRGASHAAVAIDQTLVKTAYIGKEILEADSLISIAHFKGHELSGFGGAIKNVGMGCASRKGKLDQHSDLSPKVKRKKCVGCGECVAHCAQRAIALVDGKAEIDPGRCVGCGECILICGNGAIDIQWSADIAAFQKKMAEYTLGVLKGKSRRAFFINFLTHISPACDCYGHNDAPIVQDIGILASRDPVAIDQASVDLVNRQVPSAGTCISDLCSGAEADKFHALYPKVDWSIQLIHAEKIGLGSRTYTLMRI